VGPLDVTMSQIKQVIVVRSDLGMRKGKMIAQGAHASMKVFFDRGRISGTLGLLIPLTSDMQAWVQGKFAKVCVRAESEEQLLDLHKQAKQAGLPCAIIQDSGKTEFHGVLTYTALAIGPAKAEEIDPITGELKLL
jgi:PTH2 family peptidyl-tRNA hydrolase